MQNWDAALADLDILKEVIDQNVIQSYCYLRLLLCVVESYTSRKLVIGLFTTC